MTRPLLASILLPVVIGLIAIAAVAAQMPWLAPSLASAAFAQILAPDQPSSRPWAISVGQLAGAVGGFVGVFLAHAAAAPMFFGHHPLLLSRAFAIAVAVLIAAVLQFALKATTPAGGATAVVVAIGAETPDWSGAGHLAVGIALVTVFGEMARRLVLRGS